MQHNIIRHWYFHVGEILNKYTIKVTLTNTERLKVWNDTNLEGQEYPILRRKGLVMSPQKLGDFPLHSFSHLSWFEVPPMLRVYNIIYLSWLTNYNSHTDIQYCITIHYHSCSIDKYRNVEGSKCHNFGRLGISLFEKEGFFQDHHTSPK